MCFTFKCLLILLLNKQLFESLTLHEKKNFCLTKICEEDRKDHFFVTFRMFHESIIISDISFKQKCKKALQTKI